MNKVHFIFHTLCPISFQLFFFFLNPTDVAINPCTNTNTADYAAHNLGRHLLIWRASERMSLCQALLRSPSSRLVWKRIRSTRREKNIDFYKFQVFSSFHFQNKVEVNKIRISESKVEISRLKSKFHDKRETFESEVKISRLKWKYW